MFNGVQELTIDAKGRLAIPTKFRVPLQDMSGSHLYVTLEHRDYLILYPEHAWRDVEAQLLNMQVAGNATLKKFQQLVLGHAEALQPDATGRILLPPSLQKLVRFDTEVTMVGRGNRMELWSRTAWDEQTAAALDIDEDELAEELGKTTLRL